MRIPEIIKKVLAAFDIREDEEIDAYLSPKLSDLPSPWDLKGMREAVDKICHALSHSYELVIWGDYDVDGTSGTALLVNFFRELGTETLWYIPNRLEEGYGVNTKAFDKIFRLQLQAKPFLLITVDCGISNAAEIADIQKLGGEVIVTDHHQLPLEKLPDCIIINPSQGDCGFHNKKLSGVGVAFYLAAAIRSRLASDGFFSHTAQPNLKEYLGFVALGTIADLVEMTPANRILVRGGMETLKNPKIPGLQSLLNTADLNGQMLTTEDISFTLAPRINAAGRLGEAEVAVQLMTSDNLEDGTRLGKRLIELNDKRKSICDNNLELALSIYKGQQARDKSVIVIAGEFHFGIIGIVASKLIDLFGKPAIVFTKQTDEAGRVVLKGSGRSIPGVDLLACLHEAAPMLMRYGGHAMAAGLALYETDLRQFTKIFDLSVHRQLLQGKHNNLFQQVIECDVNEIMSKEALSFLLLLEPFGPERQRPTFTDKEATIVQSRLIGNAGQHLQLTVRGRYENYRAVGFGLGERYADIQKLPTRKLTFTPMLNRFRGQVEWQLRIIDI